MQTTSQVPKTYRFFYTRELTLPEMINATRKNLKNIFGIESLSLCERIHLRRIVKTMAENVDKQWKIFDGGGDKSFSNPGSI